MKGAMKWFLSLLASTAILCGGFLVLHGSLPPVSINAWLPAGNLTAVRAGAASVLLQDGRLLITGGNGAAGVLATTDILDPSSGFTPGPPMSFARSNHVAVLLQDGRVLVAGGTGADGRASQSAELFDPAKNTWSAAGPLMVGRSGATATLLPSGQVLIAGGTANGAALQSLELFDPNANTFSLVAGTLSSARENHAAALLPDGRVLIAGGWDGTTVAPVPPATAGSPNVLASTDIFDPATGAVAPGPALASPRMNFTVTTALDGSVVAIGGTDGQNDLASIGVLAPGAGAFVLTGAQLTTARQGHQAFLLPHNGNILVVGGTASGVSISSADLYTPWTSATSVTGAMASARSGATGSPLLQTILGAPVGIDGALLVAGGLDAASPPNALASAEVYGFATIKTDQSDYPPGTPVTITGSGWQPGETVQMSLVENPDLDNDSPIALTAIADANGNITNTSFSTNIEDLSVHFTLTATGAASQAQTTFTDNKNVTITFASSGSGSVANNANSNTCTDSAGSASGTGCVISAGNTATVTLTATATSPSTIGAWTVPAGYTITSGTCTTGNATCTFTLDNNARTVTLAFNPGAASKYLVTSSNNSPAAGSQVTITAQLADSGGNPVHTSGKTVTWAHTGSGGSFSAGTSVTDANGVATVNFTTGTVAATVYTITATDNTSITGTSGNITTVAGTFSTLIFGQQPTNTLAGQTITPAVTVIEQDSNGNTITSDNSTHLTISIFNNPGSGTLSGTTNVVVSAGVATFSTLSINNTGNGYTLQAHAPSNVNVTSSPFNITGQLNITFAVSGMPTGGSADSTGTVVSISGTSGGVAVGPFNETAANLPFTHSFDSGTTVTYTYSSPVATGSASKQYRWNTTSGLSQTLQSNSFTVSAAGTVTGNYVAQYKVTFDASSNVKGDSTATIVTVGANAETAASLPYTTDFLDSGSSLTYSYASPVASSSASTTTQYRWDTTSGLAQTLQSNTFSVTAAGTVTATYVAQYKVTFDASTNVKGDSTATIVTVAGNPKTAANLPFTTGFLDSGSSLSYSYASPVASSSASTTTQYRWDSTSGLSQTLQTNSFTVSAAGTVIGNYTTQYQVMFDASSNVKGDSTATIVTVDAAAKAAGSLPFGKFVDSGTSVMYSYSSPVASSGAPTTTQYRWSSTSGLSQTLQSNSFSVTAPGTVTATYVTQYQVMFDASSNVKGDSTATIVTVDAAAKAAGVLPFSKFVDSGTSVTYSYSSPVASSSAPTTTQYRWDSTSGLGQTLQGNTFSVTAPGTVTATYVTQYQVMFDASSNVKGDSTATIVTVDAAAKAAGSLPFGKFVDSGTSVMYSYASPVASSGAPTTTRYRWDTTSGLGQTMQTNTFSVTTPGTVTGNYVAQYKVTFDASTNVKGDSSATIVTVGANAETAASLPYTTDFLDNGSSLTYSYASPVASSSASTTTRYRWDSTSGLSQTLQSNTFTVTGAGTITGNYVAQYKVTFDASSNVKGDSTATVVTVAGNAKTHSDLPFTTDFLDSGISLTYSYASPVASSGSPSDTQYRWGSTSGLGQTLQGNTLTVSAAGTVTGTYVTQYKVTFGQTGIPGSDIAAATNVVTVNGTPEPYSALPYSAYFDSGSPVPYTYYTPIASSNAGERFVLTSASPATIASLSAPTTVTGTYVVQYQVTFATSGLGSDATGTATVVNFSGTAAGSPASGSVTVAQLGTSAASAFFDSGKTLSYTYGSPVSTGDTHKRYILTTPAPTPGSGFTVTMALTITAAYKAQYDTTTTVASPVANPSILAQPIHFTATVTVLGGGPTPATGSVQFSIDGSPFGSPVTLSGGTASSATTSTLAVGPHTVRADYTPDTDTYTGSYGTLSQTVQYASGGVCDGDLGHSILQPVNVDGSSVFKQTSTVPAKFRVCDYNGNSIGTPGVVSSFRLVKVVSGTTVNTVDEAVDSTTPDTMFRWDPTGQQWIFNISTKYAPVNIKNQTYYFTISLNDSSTITFIFGLR